MYYLQDIFQVSLRRSSEVSIQCFCDIRRYVWHGLMRIQSACLLLSFATIVASTSSSNPSFIFATCVATYLHAWQSHFGMSVINKDTVLHRHCRVMSQGV